MTSVRFVLFAVCLVNLAVWMRPDHRWTPNLLAAVATGLISAMPRD